MKYYVTNNIHIVEIPVKDFSIVMNDSKKKTAATKRISKIVVNVNDTDMIFTSRTFVRYPYYNQRNNDCQVFFYIFYIFYFKDSSVR